MNRRQIVFLGLVLTTFVDGGALPRRRAHAPNHTSAIGRASIDGRFGQTPLAFEINEGQFGRDAAFAVRASQGTILLGSEPEVTFTSRPQQGSPSSVRLRLLGTTGRTLPRGERQLEGRVNYFRGRDPRGWRVGIRTYGAVRYPAVYPGVDLLYYGNPRALEYDLVVGPRRDPGVIALSFTGAHSVNVNDSGALDVDTGNGNLRQRAPVAYQEIGGRRHAVHARYVKRGPDAIGFAIDQYDESLPLVIDPVLDYSTYLGGSIADAGNAIAVDAFGSAYVTGFATSPDLPTVRALQASPHSSYDVFVAKFSPAGDALQYLTYLGGSGIDTANTIAVDGGGNAYIAGATDSLDFPMAHPLRGVNAGDLDGFVAKLDPVGSTLVYSTYLGGSADDMINSIAIGASGDAYVTGWTSSADFPTSSARQPIFGGSSDAFATRITASGSGMVYSTFLGGSADEIGHGVAVDASGNAYLTGQTSSTDFPVANAIQPTKGGGSDAYVTKLSANGAVLIYSTYLGGLNNDSGTAIAIDSAANVYVAGNTFGLFPLSGPPPFQNVCQDSSDAFLTKIAAAGTPVNFSTCLGGSGFDYASGVAVDGAYVYVAGGTESPDFPLQHAANIAGGTRTSGFVVKAAINAPLIYSFGVTDIPVAIVYATRLGGNQYDSVSGIAIDPSGAAYVTGQVESTDFPTANAIQPILAGATDAFVTKIRTLASDDAFITTIAGTPRVMGDSGDGGSATLAQMTEPRNVAVDAAYNLYIADSGANRIRKVSAATGIITTVAGNGTPGFSGDNGPATAAQLNNPWCVAVDGSGNLYIADTNNNRIRKVAAGSGIITTVAGTTAGFSGDGGPALNAQLKMPRSVVVDASGSLIIADTSNNVVRKVSSTTGVITRVGGTGVAGFAGDGGLAVAAQLNTPYSVALDASGNIFIADRNNARVRRVSATGGLISTIAGNGDDVFEMDEVLATDTGIGNLEGIAIDPAGTLFLADAEDRIRAVVLASGTITTTAGAGDGRTDFDGDNYYARIAHLTLPRGVGMGPAGALFIADTGNRIVRRAGCDYKLSAPAQTQPLSGGNGSVTLTTESGCWWTVVSYAPWITITSPTSGTGNATLQYMTTSSNGYRSGVFALQGRAAGGLPGLPAGLPVVITQSGPLGTPTVFTQPNDLTVRMGHTASFGTTAAATPPALYQWQVSTNQGASWTNLKNAGVYDGATTGFLTIKRTPRAVNRAQYRCVISNSAGTVVTRAASLTVVPPVAVGDFDGDGRADITVLRPTTGQWFSLNSLSNYTTFSNISWGMLGDVPVAGDYDGDRIADIAVYRPSTGVWYILLSSTNFANYIAYAWGAGDDVAVPGDYDGDGKTDIAVYRPSTGAWYILFSGTGFSTYSSYVWGLPTDAAVPGDFDGDGTTDIAVFRQSTGEWFILKSSTAFLAFDTYRWGMAGDLAAQGDYDGDGRADPSIFRPSTGEWHVLLSSTGYTSSFDKQWGTAGDRPVPADYDGDGKNDLAVFRPSSGVWYVLLSGSNYTVYFSAAWGTAGDAPVVMKQ